MGRRFVLLDHHKPHPATHGHYVTVTQCRRRAGCIQVQVTPTSRVAAHSGRFGRRACRSRRRRRSPPRGRPVAVRRTPSRRSPPPWSCRPAPAHDTDLEVTPQRAPDLGLEVGLPTLVGRRPRIDQTQRCPVDQPAPAATRWWSALRDQLVGPDPVGVGPVGHEGDSIQSDRPTGSGILFRLWSSPRCSTATRPPAACGPISPSATVSDGRRTVGDHPNRKPGDATSNWYWRGTTLGCRWR